MGDKAQYYRAKGDLTAMEKIASVMSKGKFRYRKYLFKAGSLIYGSEWLVGKMQLTSTLPCVIPIFRVDLCCGVIN